MCCLSLTGCMQHNGNIGDWFGTWKLESMSVDGVDSPDYDGNIFFQFQTDVVRMVEVDTERPATRRECFGRWNENDRTLTLDFSYTADGMGSLFEPVPASLMHKGVNTLNVDSQSSKRMQWTMLLHDPDRTVTYYLKKQ